MKTRVDRIYAGAGFIRLLIDRGVTKTDARWKKSIFRLIGILRDEFEDKPEEEEPLEGEALFEEAKRIFGVQ